MITETLTTVCLLCRTRVGNRSTAGGDHFCNSKNLPPKGKAVTIWNSCSMKVFRDPKLPLRVKLATLLHGLASWVGGKFDD